jgi:large subunit ribosomal protein L6
VSRIGKLPIQIPGSVEVTVKNGMVSVKGPKGELSQKYDTGLTVEREEDKLVIKRPSDEIKWRSLHGLTRTLINNMVVGVETGYSKTLNIEGVGYKAELKEKFLVLTLGFSHPIYILPPEGISISLNSPTQIVVSGIDKFLVGSITAKIRSFRPPEPYKGKGIRYEGEIVRRKAGKTAG